MNDRPDHEKIWHRALTTQQSVRIRKIHAILGEDILGLFEPFEARFLCVLDIDAELLRYEKIVRAFEVWKKEHPGEDFLCSEDDAKVMTK